VDRHNSYQEMENHIVDLDAYAGRIGFRGSLRPTKEVLDDLLYHHVSSIPFENLDILRGLVIRLDLASLEDQLVHKRRGGYCFQQNGLLLGVLRQIGFDVTPLSARIRLGLERDQTPPRTHLTLSIRIEGEDWICDAGAGGGSLTSVIRRHSSEEQMTRHEARRIVEEGGRFFHQMHSDGGWMDVYEFTGEEMPEIDREVANWWTSTSPNAKFAKSLMASRALPNGERIGLMNDNLTRRQGSTVLEKRTIQSAAELLKVLRTDFGLDFPEGTRFGSGEKPWPTS
jgi:N-hydroxyarylamine O-acetyltransferase